MERLLFAYCVRMRNSAMGRFRSVVTGINQPKADDQPMPVAANINLSRLQINPMISGMIPL